MRGSSMSPEIEQSDSPPSAAKRVPASGRDRRSPATTHRRRPGRRRRACRGNARGLPARRGGRRCRGRGGLPRRLATMPCAANSAQMSAKRMRRSLVEDRVRGQELGPRHHHGTPEAFHQPRRIAQMVRMVVRRDDARDRQSAERSSRNASPTARASPRRHSRSRQRSSRRSPRRQPQVDVVERERQRHPDPQYPGGHGALPSPGAGGAANG